MAQVTYSKKGGPYSKSDRAKRQNEVFRLHFDFGYSAARISEMMNINRNTINSDINYWYDKLGNEFGGHDLRSWSMKQIHRFESQRARLMMYLEKTEKIETRITLEKLLSDIDGKLFNMFSKLFTSNELVSYKVATELNEWAKKHKIQLRHISGRDIVFAPTDVANKVIKELEESFDKKVGKM